jgi:hypothetical protein
MNAMSPLFSSITLASAVLLCGIRAHGQIADYPDDTVAGIPVNYTEAKVGTYTLPDPLVLANGTPVRDVKPWNEKRRSEILRLFEENEYGRTPGRPVGMSFDVFDNGTPALDGKAIRRQVTVFFSKDKNGPKMDLLLYLPGSAQKPVPVLLNIGFSANSLSVDDPGIKPGEVWNAKEKIRIPAAGTRSFGKLPVTKFLAEGIGVATVYYGDIDPDFPAEFHSACANSISSRAKPSRLRTNGAPSAPGRGA